MTGSGDPPPGEPEGAQGGDDEYRSVVFDESFVEAARIQEYSAQERIEDERHAAVHDRPGDGTGGEAAGAGVAGAGVAGEHDDEPGGRGGGRRRTSGQGIVLVLLIVVAFGTAIYMGISNPYQNAAPAPTPPLRVSMLPLAPEGQVRGAATPEALFERSPAAEFRKGADGVTLPSEHGTEHFSESQILSALSAAKEYVVTSSIDRDVLGGGGVRSVRLLLDPGQQAQFDRSLEQPRTDGRHAATGWMVRFDPAKVGLADAQIRVDGTLAVEEAGADSLLVTADHVFVYAVRPAAADGGADAGDDRVSLFTVRREVQFAFERSDLRDQQLSVENVSMRAGPMSCATDPSGTFTPLLAGERATGEGPAGTDPYAEGEGATASMCGVLAESARPDLR